MGNINKDIERCKELIKIEHSNWIGMSNQDAISNVLLELEKEKTKNLELNIELKTFKQSNKNLLAKKSELETYKKIAEKLAIELYITKKGDEICKNADHSKCVQRKVSCIDCIIDWARKEVEKDE